MGTQRRRQAPPLTFSNAQAERGLLGYYFARTGIDATLQAEVLALEEELFHTPLHVAVLGAIQTVVAAGDAVDLVSVSDVLRRTNPRTAIALDLVDMLEQAAVTPDAHQRILEECRRRRHLDALLQHAHARVLDPASDLDRVVVDTRAALNTTTTTPGARFALLSDEDLDALPAPTYQITQLFELGRFVVVFGPPESAKSLLVLAIALSTTTGLPFLDRAVVAGPAVIVAAEGAPGYRDRVRAWKIAHEVIGGAAGLHFVFEAVNLLQPGDVDLLLATLARLPARPSLLVVDTLARCMVGGDENSARDMGLAIAAIDRLRTALGCTVLVVHHTTKSGEWERGSGALRGAADTMLAIAKDGDTITVSCAKSKDASPFAPFTVTVTPLGESVVLLPSSAVPKDSTRPTGSALKALSILVDFFDADGATYSQWFSAFVGSGDKQKLHTSFLRARKDLIEHGWVTKEGRERGAPYCPTTKGVMALRSTRVREGSSGLTGPVQDRVQSGPPPYRGGPDGPDDGPELENPATLEPAAEPCSTCGTPGGVGWSSTGEQWCEACWLQRIASG